MTPPPGWQRVKSREEIPPSWFLRSKIQLHHPSKQCSPSPHITGRADVAWIEINFNFGNLRTWTWDRTQSNFIVVWTSKWIVVCVSCVTMLGRNAVLMSDHTMWHFVWTEPVGTVVCCLVDVVLCGQIILHLASNTEGLRRIYVGSTSPWKFHLCRIRSPDKHPQWGLEWT